MRMWTNPPARGWRGGRRVEVTAFHAKLPDYRPTPLVPLPALAERLGVAAVLVKDESRRFGLPAFKMLGASWGVYRALCERIGGEPEWHAVIELRERLAAHRFTLVTATAGNHGRAVARMGRWLGLQTLVLVPANAASHVVSAIESDGARVRRADGPYDDAVAAAAELAADRPRHLLVQDTAWPGYETIPQWIVEGYQTLFRELDAQAPRQPDLVVVPVGVGSLMSAAIQYYRAPDAAHPALLGVEPATAACALASLHAGRPVRVDTPGTVMAGLDAGVVSTTAWPLLRDGLDAAVAVTDAAATTARETLAGFGLDTGLCGAATLAALSPPYELDAGSTVVLIGTDGHQGASA